MNCGKLKKRDEICIAMKISFGIMHYTIPGTVEISKDFQKMRHIFHVLPYPS